MFPKPILPTCALEYLEKEVEQFELRYYENIIFKKISQNNNNNNVELLFS